MSKKKKNDKASKPATSVEETPQEDAADEAVDSTDGGDADDGDAADDDADEAPAHSNPEPTLSDKGGHAAAHAAGAHHHAPNRKEYWRIFGALAALTALEVGIAYLEGTLGKTALVTALVGLALTKAALVAHFFMHLKHETKVMKWTVAIPMSFPAMYAFILIAEGMYRAVWGTS